MIATPLPDAGRFAATTRPRVVIDTDAFNEIDDQFALAWALRSAERMSVEAVYAAPFHNERSIGPGDGMRKSLAEIGNVLDALGGEPPAVRAGAEEFLTGGSPRRSPAVDDLIARAASSAPDDPLHVIAIGAPTNIASALLIEPSIARGMRVVWLGGHSFDWPRHDEFNLRPDPAAAATLLEAAGPTMLIPCNGVASHLSTSLAEVSAHLDQDTPIGRLLTARLAATREEHIGYSRVIWDLAPVAALLLPNAVPAVKMPAPSLADDLSWRFDDSRPPIHVARHVDRNAVFRDLFLTLRG